MDETKEEKTNINTSKTLEVGAYIYVYRVNDVSLSDQRFHAYFHIEFQWEATKEDNELYLKDPSNYKPVSWSPEFVCLNGKFELNNCKAFKIAGKGNTNSWNMKITKMRKDCKINLSHYELEGDFNERFELENFPLDCQDLQIVIRSLSSINNIVFVPPFVTDFHCGGLSLESSQLDTYIVHTPLIEYHCNNYGYENNDDAKFSKITFRIKLERKYAIFLVKICVFVFITAISALIVFTMNNYEEQIADRYGTLLTLLLTMVAFQFVIESTLPTLP
eukprot:380713_1